MDLSPSAEGMGTHLDYGIDFEGHGLGKLVAPLARAGTRQDLATRLESLKRRIEGRH